MIEIELPSRGDYDVDALAHAESAAIVQAPWHKFVMDSANLKADDRVLDLGCGSGALSLYVQQNASKPVSITGLEANPELYQIAQSRSSQIEWRLGDITDGHFNGAGFDVAMSAFSLGRFNDPEDALVGARMALRSKGRIVVSAWSAGASDGVRRMLIDLISRHASPVFTASYAAQFSLGVAKMLGAAANAAGFSSIMLQRRREWTKFPSLENFVDAEIAISPLAHKVNPVQRAGLMAEARNKLHKRVKRDGKFVVPLESVVLTAKRL